MTTSSAVKPLVAVLFLVSGLNQGLGGFVEDETRLREALFSNYSTKVRPQYKTHIAISGVLSSLHQLDIAMQSMSININLQITWADSRLVWDPAAYGGIRDVITAPEDVWTPPIVVENAVEGTGVIGGADNDATPLRISANGYVFWFPPCYVTTTCQMLIRNYPLDTQRCNVTLLGWSYPLAQMNITKEFVDFEQLYTPSGEFDLISASSYELDLLAGGPQGEEGTYRKINLELTFRRKWQFYGQNLLMPIVLNSILMNGVFLVPLESGEKLGYCLTVLLSYVVFLTWVTDNLPPVSTDTSILQVYLAVILVLGCLATLLTTWVLQLFHRPKSRPMGPLYSAVADRLLVPFFLFMHGSATDIILEDDDEGNGRLVTRPATRGGARVFPLSPGVTTVTSYKGDLKVSDFDEKDFAKSPLGADTQQKQGRKVRVYSWQELAVVMDHFFFWVFGVLILLVTTAILTLLYVNY